MAARRPASGIPTTPPEHLSELAAEVWAEVVARDRIHPAADPRTLEAYCELTVRWRQASDKITDEGIVVDGGDKRGAVAHPALAAERQMAEQLREWGPMFNRPARAARRRGTMYDATNASIKAAPEVLDEDRFQGACQAVLTLAWLIDEAQREGLEALRKASYSVIPSYLKGMGELGLTPAELPEEIRKKEKTGGKVTKFTAGRSRSPLAAV